MADIELTTAPAETAVDSADEFYFNDVSETPDAINRATLANVLGAILLAIRGISASNDDIIQWKSGAPTNRTPAQLKTDLALVKADVGLGNVDNTSNATERAATATLTNKTIDAASNTITNIGASEIEAGIITDQTAETTVNDADVILIYDASGSVLRKMTRANFLAGSGGGASIGGAVSGGTANSVPYIDASGNLAQENANLNYDASTDTLTAKRLQANLDTNGKFIFDSVEADWGGLWVGNVTRTNSNHIFYASQTVNSGHIKFSTPRYMDFFANGTQLIRLINDGSTVGVGLGYITNPKSGVNVHVKPATSSYIGMAISQAASQSAFLLEFRQSDEGTVIGGFNKDAALLAPKAVVPKVANHPITVQESGSVFTNEGTTAKRDFTLPSAAAGLTYTFVVQDSDGLRVVAGAGDTIRIGAGVSAAAGNADSATIGNVLTLVAINATEWFATYSIGTWTLT